jgi:hypothetical protein
MEQSLFQELLNQANNGKRADSEFKREAWIAACEAVIALTTQDVTVERCKGKAEVMKALWKEFIVTALARVRAGRSVHIYSKVSIRDATLILCLFGQMAES